MNPLFRLPAVIFCGFLAASPLHAQEGGAFLRTPMSARAAGLGDSSIAAADEPLGVYYNPAGLVFLKRQAVSLVHHTYLQDISGNSLAFASPFRNWAVGLAPAVFGMKEEPVYDSLGNATGGGFGYKRTIIPVAAAYRLGNLGLGLAVKSYSEELGGQASGTTIYDAGVLYRRGAWRCGFSAQNYGGRVFGYEVMKIQRLGAAYAGGSYLLTADLKKEGEAGSLPSIGVAVSPVDAVTLRGGWRFRKDFGGLAFGLGLELGGLSFDYAFLSYGDFGSAQKAGLTFAFGPAAGDRAKLKTFWKRVGEAAGIAPSRLRTAKVAAGASAAVAEFAGTGEAKAGAAALTGEFRAALAGTAHFKVLDKKGMETTLDEQKFRSRGCSEHKCAVEMGGLLNVNLLFTGSLSKDAEGWNIQVEAADIETGKIAAFYEIRNVSDPELKTVCPKIVKKMFVLQ